MSSTRRHRRASNVLRAALALAPTFTCALPSKSFGRMTYVLKSLVYTPACSAWSAVLASPVR